jgi:hypothetical protein
MKTGQSGSFSDAKEPKRLFIAGPSAFEPPGGRGKKVFCADFFQKSGYFSFFSPGNPP